ncbi:MAG: GumC family protein [Blastopirellula sp. JB062]
MNGLLDSAQFQYWRKTIVEKKWLILAPMIACSLLTLGFALLKTNLWSASQTLVIRDAAIGHLEQQGRFNTLDDMRTAQETIVQVARSTAVVKKALEAVGPTKPTAGFPSFDDVDTLRGRIEIAPPNGAEFGTTEVLILSVEASSRQRAAQLATALCDQLEIALQRIRNGKAASVISELDRAAQLAQDDLNAATAQLSLLEKSIGSDLGELRSINETSSGDGKMQATHRQIADELRQAESHRDMLIETLQLLDDSKNDPKKLMAAPNQLLAAQPALRRLKDGLVDAQLNKSKLLGRMNADHPQVRAALAAEAEVRENLLAELAVAHIAVANEMRVNQALIDSLVLQEAEVQSKLGGIAGIRAQYDNLASNVRDRLEHLAEAQKQLSDAKANLISAESTSLITRVDQPVVSTYPVGPGKAMLVLAGLVGGLAIGVGLLVITSPGPAKLGRRLSDRLWGKRASDHPDGPAETLQPGGRRAADPPVQNARNSEKRRGGDRRSGRDRRTANNENSPPNDRRGAGPVVPPITDETHPPLPYVNDSTSS